METPKSPAWENLSELGLNDENPSAALAVWVLFHHIGRYSSIKILRGTERRESIGNEHSLFWPTLSQAWQRLKGGLERALQDWISGPAKASSQYGNMVPLGTKRQHKQSTPRKGAQVPILTVPSPVTFLFATLGA